MCMQIAEPGVEQPFSYSATEQRSNDVIGVWLAARKLSNLIDRRVNLALSDTRLSVRSFLFMHWADRLTEKSLSSIRQRAGISASEATRLIKILQDARY